MKSPRLARLSLFLLLAVIVGMVSGCAAFRRAFNETPEEGAAKRQRQEQRKRVQEERNPREEVIPTLFPRKQEPKKPSLLLDSGGLSPEERDLMERELNQQNQLTAPGSIHQSMPRTQTPSTDDWVFGGFQLF